MSSGLNTLAVSTRSRSSMFCAKNDVPPGLSEIRLRGPIVAPGAHISTVEGDATEHPLPELQG